MATPIKMYSLSTCGHCKATKRFLNDCMVEYDSMDVDLLEGEERAAILEEIRKWNPNCSFPTIIIGDRVIVGHREDELREALGLTNNVELLFETMKKVQEPKGYFFNRDKEHVTQLLEALLTNKERYGYMACPCRLASGDREKDKDIVCPCVYREADVKEYGSCYCNLYVSKEWNEDKIPHVYVPERRKN
ncbi:MAG: glutaredoxin [Deltaproteobacteria bacterium]|nr:MAG: glutaredoxin [Deltaproteobacteria bacterium]